MDEKGVNKYSVYLQDEQVSRWFRNLTRGSPMTRDIVERARGILLKYGM